MNDQTQEYLMSYVVPFLAQGIDNIHRLRPEDPFEYLCCYFADLGKRIETSWRINSEVRQICDEIIEQCELNEFSTR